MPNLKPGITASYQEMVESQFQMLLQQRGSKLLQYVPQQMISGDSSKVRLVDIGGPQYQDDHGGITQWNTASYGTRWMTPRAFTSSTLFDTMDIVRQGILPDVNEIATIAMLKCSNEIDKIIIKGIGGPAKTDAGDANLGADQTIAWNCNLTFAGGGAAVDTPPAGSDIPLSTWRGLNSSKVNQGVRVLAERHNFGNVFVLCSEYARETFKGDPRVGNMLWNAGGPALSTNVVQSYGGVLDFITSPYLDHNPANPDIEYAYMFSQPMIRLGVNFPLSIEWGKNAERGNSDAMFIKGSYACARVQEEGVVRIEINKNLA